MIELKQITKSYPVAEEDLVVLKDIDLTIQEGEFVAIMGPSGSGKSTLMNMIGCLDKPTAGEYLLHGNQVSAYDEKELAGVRNRSVGFVFQQFQLLPRLNALENVELPMIYAGVGKKERLERAEEALDKVGLSNRKRHLPNELSGGQKQRVAIARSIVNQPDLILADEPTGALDSKTGVQIMEMFTMLNQEGTTVILVTHEAEVASYANRTIFVRDGEITTADEVVDKTTYERLVSSHATEDTAERANQTAVTPASVESKDKHATTKEVADEATSEKITPEDTTEVAVSDEQDQSSPDEGGTP